MATYDFSFIIHFANGVNIPQLMNEITSNPMITAILQNITIDNYNTDTVHITFDVGLAPSEITELNTIVTNHFPLGYGQKVIITSDVPDNDAIQILATNPYGGIIIESGIGGIHINTDDALLIQTNAQSEFAVTDGNLLLRSTNATTDLNGYTGINIGNHTSNGPVNIITAAHERILNIGNLSGATEINLMTGTGGLAIDTADGPINLTASGAPINLTANTVTIDTNISVGINSNGGQIGIGHFSSGPILIGTAAFGRDVQIGNNINGTNLYQRHSNARVQSQPLPLLISDSVPQILTTADLLSIILYGTPISDVILTLYDAPTIVSNIANLQNNDCFEFNIINQSLTNIYTLFPGTGGTSYGNMVIQTNQSGMFRVHLVDVSIGTESYNLYRIC